jgi:hypothetical protein
VADPSAEGMRYSLTKLLERKFFFYQEGLYICLLNNNTMRIIKLTYQAPESQKTAFANAIDKVIAQLPKNSPDTVVVRKSDTVACFDLRYIAPMLWERTIQKLGLIDAKEIGQTTTWEGEGKKITNMRGR